MLNAHRKINMHEGRKEGVPVATGGGEAHGQQCPDRRKTTSRILEINERKDLTETNSCAKNRLHHSHGTRRGELKTPARRELRNGEVLSIGGFGEGISPTTTGGKIITSTILRRSRWDPVTKKKKKPGVNCRGEEEGRADASKGEGVFIRGGFPAR